MTEASTSAAAATSEGCCLGASYRAIFSVNGTRQVVTLARETLSWVPYTPPTSFPAIPPPPSNPTPSAASTSSSSPAEVVLPLTDACVISRSGPRSFALHCLSVFEKVCQSKGGEEEALFVCLISKKHFRKNFGKKIS
jgi:hypothetical protein